MSAQLLFWKLVAVTHSQIPNLARTKEGYGGPFIRPHKSLHRSYKFISMHGHACRALLHGALEFVCTKNAQNISFGGEAFMRRSYASYSTPSHSGCWKRLPTCVNTPPVKSTMLAILMDAGFEGMDKI